MLGVGSKIGLNLNLQMNGQGRSEGSRLFSLHAAGRWVRRFQNVYLVTMYFTETRRLAAEVAEGAMHVEGFVRILLGRVLRGYVDFP
jgi:hypothetical protein